MKLNVFSLIGLLVFLSCSVDDPSSSAVTNTDPEIVIPVVLGYVPDTDYLLSAVTNNLDFTEVLKNTSYVILSMGEGPAYPFEIRNELPWLSFSVLTGNVTTELLYITATVDFLLFETQEIKEGTIQVISGDQSITIPVTAQNYSISDPTSLLDTDHRSFTVYNTTDDICEFELQNTGTGLLVYSFESDSSWLTLDLPAGYITDTSSVSIPYLIDWSLIEDNDLSTGIITITNHKDPLETKSITIKARSVPELYVSKNVLNQSTDSNFSNSFEVGNSLARSLPYTIITDASWLSFSSTSGDVILGSNDTIEVFVDYTSFTEGVPTMALILIDSDYGNDFIGLSAIGYPSFSTSSININLKSIDNPTDNITITNTGSGVLDYTISTDCEWLGSFTNSGSLNHGESEEMFISPDFDNMAWDIYNNAIVDLSIGNESKQFSINAMRQVDPEQDPRLHVNRSSISIPADTDISEDFIITNTGTGIMNYSIAASFPSIILSNESGTLTTEESDTLTFSIDWSLVTSDFIGYISISTDGVYDNSHVIMVNRS